VFTIYAADSKEEIVVNLLLPDNTLQGSIAKFAPYTGTYDYSTSQIINGSGTYKWEIDYNGSPEASITFLVQ
jgi:hypothetical protein